MQDEGWEFVNIKTHKLVLLDGVNNAQPATTLIFPRNMSRLDIFLAFFSPDLVARVLEKRIEENPDVLYENAGCGLSRKLVLTTGVVYQYFACRAFVHGYGRQPGKNQYETMKWAHTFLQELSGCTLVGIKRIQRVHSVWRMTSANDEEGHFSKNLLGTVRRMGQCFCGDEKLFRFTGRHRYIRAVKSKPARVGLWHFQGAVSLENGLSYVVHTKLNNTNKAAGETSYTVDVTTEWAEAVLQHNPNSVLFMDSYYMCKAGIEMVREKRLKVIAALQLGRFKQFKKYMDPKVRNAGETSYLHNNQTGETIVYHWSVNSSI